MRVLVRILTGIVWSILFFIGSVLLGALVVSCLEYVLVPTDFINTPLRDSLIRVIAIAVVVLGTITGFLTGYTRALKKDAQNIDNKRLVKKLVFPIIVLFITGFVVYVLVLNMRAYNRYGFFVHVSDESVFTSQIEPCDPRIINHGRIKKEKIVGMDREIDNGDGRRKGKVRWYECYGIDCDEGWENRFSKR